MGYLFNKNISFQDVVEYEVHKLRKDKLLNRPTVNSLKRIIQLHIENNQIKIFTIIHPKDLTKVYSKNIQNLLQIRKSYVKKKKLKLFWSDAKHPHRYLFATTNELESFCTYVINTNPKVKMISDSPRLPSKIHEENETPQTNTANKTYTYSVLQEKYKKPQNQVQKSPSRINILPFKDRRKTAVIDVTSFFQDDRIKIIKLLY